MATIRIATASSYMYMYLLRGVGCGRDPGEGGEGLVRKLCCLLHVANRPIVSWTQC